MSISRFRHALLRLLTAVPLVVTMVAPDGSSRDGYARETGMARIIPNGAVPDAGWALARLNDGADMVSQSFAYPETTNPVRLYLIDTGVAHADTWFAGNANLKSFQSVLVRATGDPTTSTVVDHGTRMLSLIAGPETGAALGTPIHVVNFNIYPGTEAATVSGLLEDAILQAIDYQADQAAQNNDMPAVICIANGSSFPGAESSLMEEWVTAAVDAGIPVIVSAGNEGGDAAEYIPAAYGVHDGVICVGASDENNQKLPNSNEGPAVDLYAPGFNVRTVDPANVQPGAFSTATGTSPATALVAAAALIQLSIDPDLTPTQVENALSSAAFPSAATSVTLVQVQPDPEGDSDSDGTSDIIESFFGSNPADPATMPAPMVISRPTGQARLAFGVSAELFNPANPYVLSDGSTWKVRMSPNLTDWQDATGALVPGTANGGVVPVTFSVPSAGPKCFLRIEVIPPP